MTNRQNTRNILNDHRDGRYKNSKYREIITEAEKMLKNSRYCN